MGIILCFRQWVYQRVFFLLLNRHIIILNIFLWFHLFQSSCYANATASKVNSIRLKQRDNVKLLFEKADFELSICVFEIDFFYFYVPCFLD